MTASSPFQTTVTEPNGASADLAKYTPSLKRVRALCEGEEEARALVLALPGLEGEELLQFRARAYYLPALPRTIDLFTGLLMARDPTIEAPAGTASLLADATLAGDSLTTFAGSVAREVLTASRAGVLVDYPEVPQGLTAAQAEAQGLRAYMRLYQAENIAGARYEQRGGARRLTMVRLLETHEAPDGAYGIKTYPQVRILALVDGVYTVTILRNDGGWQQVSQTQPRMAGAVMREIPFFGVTDRDLSLTQRRPMLADMAGVSLAHLNNSALHEWGLMWAASPTPIITGIAPPAVDDAGRPVSESERIRLGSSEALVLPAEGDAKFLEFSGAGLASIREAMEAKRRDMAMLGARMLLEDPRAAIAAETAQIQRAGETSSLARISSLVSATLTRATGFMLQWAGVGGDVRVSLSKNFAPAGLSADEIRATLEAYQGGALSMRDVFRRFQAAEIIDPAKGFEAHQEEVQEGAPGAGVIQ